MAIDPAVVKSLFLAAAELTDLGERAALLDRECAGAPELRARVEALLRANDDALHSVLGEFDPTHLAAGVAPPEDTLKTPERKPTAGAVLAGKYKLIEPIGEGGMGQVFLAQQIEPVRRAVAVKVIKAGMDSRSVLARFDAERQALAMMDHPNIARVLDAGTTETGQPFFVMELVKGQTITKFCDERKLTPRQRLELFIPVCQAIQHAHQKGVIHRDIKPNNVLVAMYDDKPVPKVIDFGVAKATAQTLTDLTLMTGLGSLVGTLEYMSPEQASMNQLDVDTRSDVYSLGVLLYELLTGSTPVDRKSLKNAAIYEVLRIVREEEAVPPSAKLSTIDTLPSIAANRGTEPARLSRLLKGELDWVLLKALEKDRARRYETATGLARDIERYLADEVVEARPQSTAYRLKKFVRRHKGQVLAAGLVLLTLVAGIVGTSWGMWEANRAREAESDRAEGERLAKQAALAAAEAAQRAKEQADRDRDEKEQQRRFAQAIADFVKDDFLALTSVEGQFRFGDPATDRLDKDATLRQLLDRAAAKLDQRRDLDPKIEAELLWMIGVNLRALGEATRAIGYLERCVALNKQMHGPDHRETLDAQNSLAMAYRAAGRYRDAVRLFEETLPRTRAIRGADHPDTLNNMSNLAEAYSDADDWERALPLHEATLKLSRARLGDDHADTILYMAMLGHAYLQTGKLDLAIPLLEETAKRMKARLGAEHNSTLWALDHLASGYWTVGKIDVALPLAEEVLRVRKARLGAGHPQTLKSMDNLARIYRAAGKFDLALTLMEENLRLSRDGFGPLHPETLTSMNNLGEAYRVARKLDLAVPLLEQAHKEQRALLGPDHQDTLASMHNLALCYQDQKKLDQAIPLFEETVRRLKVRQSPDHPNTLICMNNLALAYRDSGKLDRALPILQEAAAGMEKLRFQHVYARRIVFNLISCQERLGQFDQAESWRRKWLPVVKEKSGADSSAYASELAALGLNLLQQKKWSQAEPVLRDALAIRAKIEREQWTTFNTQSMLGGALVGQTGSAGLGPERDKLLAEAETLLLAGYAGLKQHANQIPTQVRIQRLTEACDRLVDLYTGWEKPDEVKKWRKERALHRQEEKP